MFIWVVPMIWLVNLTLVLLFKYMFAHRRLPFVVTAVVAVGAKVAVIFCGYLFLVAVGVIASGSPMALALWSVLGVHQLITASAGCVLAYGIVKVIDKRRKV